MAHVCCLVRTDFCGSVIANLRTGMCLLLKKNDTNKIKNILKCNKM